MWASRSAILTTCPTIKYTRFHLLTNQIKTSSIHSCTSNLFSSRTLCMHTVISALQSNDENNETIQNTDKISWEIKSKGKNLVHCTERVQTVHKARKRETKTLEEWRRNSLVNQSRPHSSISCWNERDWPSPRSRDRTDGTDGQSPQPIRNQSSVMDSACWAAGQSALSAVDDWLVENPTYRPVPVGGRANVVRSPQRDWIYPG